MPHYAPYGNAIYGFTAYGAPPTTNVQTTMSVAPIASPYIGQTNIPIYGVNTSGSSSQLAGLYNSLQIQWVLPGGNWSEIILTRSAFGCPVSPYSHDGVVLVDELTNIAATPTLTNSYIDQNLQPGRFYYYSLFVYDTDIDEWLLCASAQGLCLTNYQWHHTFVDWTPDWFMEQDQLLIPPQPLDRFFKLLGFEMDWIRSEIESLFTLNSPEYISGAMLPWLGGNVGVDYEPALGMNQSRVLISNAVNLYKEKGTFNGVQAAATLYTGYPCALTIGPNIEIQLDDAAFATYGAGGVSGYAYAGHWVPGNSGTTVATVAVENQTYPLTPEHASYLPVQGPSGLASSLIEQAGANGYLPSTGTAVMLTNAAPAADWVQDATGPPGPPALYGAAAVYYPNNGTVVMFGGSSSGQSGGSYSNQTWIFNGTYWAQAFPATSPPARYYHAMAYDSATGTIIMFGGRSTTAELADTWSWNGTTWTQINVANPPLPRFGHAMAQWTNVGVLLFGGATLVGLANDTWLYSAGNWVLQNPASKPSARAFMGMAYDSFEQATPGTGNGVVVLFGGWNGDYTHLTTTLNDTWYWTGTTWANPSITGAVPSARFWHSMAYNVATDKVELFGGFNGSVVNDQDMWQWGGTSWQKITNSLSLPPVRYGAVMAWDGLGPMVMYGGEGAGNGVLADTWLFTGATAQWANTEGTQTPAARVNAAMCYDTATGDVLMYGGYDNATGVYYSGLWQYNAISGWKQLISSQTAFNTPPACEGCQMVYTTGGTVVLFGGVNSGGYLGTTYSWNGTAWTLAVTAPAPSARAFFSMYYDSSASKIVLFGGSNGSALDDTWSCNSSGTAWTQFNSYSGVAPTARYHHQMVYTTGGNGVLFGGFAFTGPGGILDNGVYQFNASGSGTWTTLIAGNTGTPGGRYSHVMAYDSSLSAIIMFGGTGTAYYTDSWEYAVATEVWSQPAFGTPAPWPRSAGMMAYDVSSNQLIYFGGTTGFSNVFFNDTWTGATVNYGINISECTSANATSLGIPVSAEQTVIFSFYVQPVPPTVQVATPQVEVFYGQLDWYGINGNLISSAIGTAQNEIIGQWVRCTCVATAPANTAYFGRTIKTESQSVNDAGHLIDAVQSEISTYLATPSASAWSPPRDLQLNLLPAERNLIINGQGYAEAVATPGFSCPNGGTLVPVTTGPLSGTWPQDTYAGFQGTTYKPAFGPYVAQVQTGMMATNPGNVYQVSFFAQMDQTHFAGPTTASLQINWCSTDNPASMFSQVNGDTLTFGTISNSSTPPTPPGQWGQVTMVNQTAPLGAYWAYLVFSIFTNNNTLSAKYWMAAPLFNEGLGTGYFDGTFSPAPDFSFEGAPFVSPSDYYPNSETRLSRLLTIMPEYIPFGATFSIFLGQQAYLNQGLH